MTTQTRSCYSSKFVVDQNTESGKYFQGIQGPLQLVPIPVPRVVYAVLAHSGTLPHARRNWCLFQWRGQRSGRRGADGNTCKRSNATTACISNQSSLISNHCHHNYLTKLISNNQNVNAIYMKLLHVNKTFQFNGIIIGPNSITFIGYNESLIQFTLRVLSQTTCSAIYM